MSPEKPGRRTPLVLHHDRSIVASTFAILALAAFVCALVALLPS